MLPPMGGAFQNGTINDHHTCEYKARCHSSALMTLIYHCDSHRRDDGQLDSAAEEDVSDPVDVVDLLTI
jgi:hypothetical protein